MSWLDWYREALGQGEHVPPSDTGVDGARPLPPWDEFDMKPPTDEEWAAQNAKIDAAAPNAAAVRSLRPGESIDFPAEIVAAIPVSGTVVIYCADGSIWLARPVAGDEEIRVEPTGMRVVREHVEARMRDAMIGGTPTGHTWIDELAPHYWPSAPKLTMPSEDRQAAPPRPHHKRRRALGNVWADRMAQRAESKGSPTAP